MTKIRDIDKGWKKHGKTVKAAARRSPHVKVGIVGPDATKAHEGAGVTTVQVATFHEFGTGITSGRSGGVSVRLPERSFIRATFDRDVTKNRAAMRIFADLVLTNRMTVKRALSLFGEKAVADTKNYMRQGIDPSKVDGTPARLKDTGQLYGALNYEVNEL